MKKLFVMVAIHATMSLVACNSLDAFDLLALSHQAQEEADINSMTMEIEGQIGMSMEGMSMDMPLTMYIEAESEERMSIKTNMSMMGEESKTTVFLRDGYEYKETDDFSGKPQRTRSETDTVISTEMVEMIEDIFNEGFLANAEESVATSSAEKTDDGYRLAFTYNIEDLLSLLGETMTEIPGMEELGDIDALLDFDEEELGEWDIEMVMYIDEDYLPIRSNITLAGELSVTDMGMEMDMTVEFTVMTTIEEVTIDFPDWLDEMNVSIEDSELLGYWEGGSGSIPLFVFGSADSVEFLENGTVIITNDGSDHTVDWSPNGPSAFNADEFPFTFSIDGDILTISDDNNDDLSFYREGTAPEEETDDEDAEESDDDKEVSREFRNALSSGRNYLSVMSFSFESLSEQLDYEGYSKEAIAWAMEQIDADTDWYEQAVSVAKSYLDNLSFSPSGLIEQLEFEGFTKSQAQHAVDIAYD